MLIDTSFDFRADAGGKDPDAYSPTLRKYHQILWSKPLPCGRLFRLVDTMTGVYLHHHSELGEFFLSSDSIIPTFTKWVSLRHIVQQVGEEENEAFRAIGYTIGGMMIFPANRIDGKQNINGARGFNRNISDRFDLTLECIRRHYANNESPLSEVMNRYRNFFDIFRDFEGFINFFLLQDLVKASMEIDFFLPFDNFQTPSIPKDVAAYEDYRFKSIAFVNSRNVRIKCQSMTPGGNDG